MPLKSGLPSARRTSCALWAARVCPEVRGIASMKPATTTAVTMATAASRKRIRMEALLGRILWMNESSPFRLDWCVGDRAGTPLPGAARAVGVARRKGGGGASDTVGRPRPPGKLERRDAHAASAARSVRKQARPHTGGSREGGRGSERAARSGEPVESGNREGCRGRLQPDLRSAWHRAVGRPDVAHHRSRRRPDAALHAGGEAKSGFDAGVLAGAPPGNVGRTPRTDLTKTCGAAADVPRRPHESDGRTRRSVAGRALPAGAAS